MFCKKNFAPQKYLLKSCVPENYKALKIIHQKHAYTLNVLMDFSTLASHCCVSRSSYFTFCINTLRVHCIERYNGHYGIYAFIPVKMKCARKIMNIYSPFFPHISKKKKKREFEQIRKIKGISAFILPTRPLFIFITAFCSYFPFRLKRDQNRFLFFAVE